MKHLGILIKTNILLFLGSVQKKHSKGRYILTGILIAWFVLFIGGSVSLQSISSSYHFTVERNQPEVGIFLSILIAAIISLLFGVMRSATPSTSKDSDLLMSMPIKKNTVLLSKILTQYLFDAPLLIVMLLPTIIATRLFGGLSAAATGRGVILVFLIPLFSLTITMLFGFFFSFLREKFSGSSVLISGIMMLAMIAFLIGNFQMTSFFNNIIEMGGVQIDTLMRSVWPVREMTHFVVFASPGSTIFALSITTLPFVLMVVLYAQRYGRKERAYRATNRNLKYEVRSVPATLLRIEIKKYFSSALYVFNSAFGSIILLVFAVAVGIVGPQRVMSLISGIEGMGERLGERMNTTYLTGVIILFFCFFAAMTITTSASISSEGKRIWILQSLPVKATDIFVSKIILNLLVFIPFHIISALVIAVRVQINVQGTLALLLLPAVMSVLFSVIGLISNLLLPKLDWRTEAEVFKQSASVLVSVLVGMVFSFLPLVVFIPFVFIDNGVYYAAYISAGIFAVFAAAGVLFLAFPGKRMFEKMIY